MKVERVSRGHKLNLDHWVFDDYEGPVKYFSSIHMTDNHFSSLAVLCHMTLKLMRKMKYAMLVSATTILLILLNEIASS